MPALARKLSALCVLQVISFEQDRRIDVHVVVQCPVIIALKEIMQIDVEEAIPRDDPPAS